MCNLKRWVVGVLAGFAVSGSYAAAQTADHPVATTDLGAVRGTVDGGRVRFLGIPFAAPPVGEGRWRAPQPAKPWKGVRNVSAPALGCIQPPLPITPGARYSEDCLYLNVYVPTARTAEPLPVMVWIFGGGFYGGAGDVYDAGRLAEQGRVMVVTINYRLGVMGYFGYPGLEGSGDFGLQDQQAALAWVRRNAAAFGGDTGNITLFGESAGAMSVCAQLVSPGARGLFDKAILQSGSCIASWPARMIWPDVAEPWNQFLPLAQVERSGSAAAVAAGCKAEGDIACLRALPPEAMTKVWTNAQPAFGGGVLPEDPAISLRAGRSAPVPVIWGTTKDEWRSAAGGYVKTRPFTAAFYSQTLSDAFGAKASEVERIYRAAGAESPILAWAAISTDVAWSCPTLESVRLAARRAPAYHYEFADLQGPNPGGAYDLAPGFDLGAGHATELEYLFDLAGRPFRLNAAQSRMADKIIGYWSAFARTGDPNHSGAPSWSPVSGPTDRRALLLDPVSDIATVDFADRHHCNLWNRVANNWSPASKADRSERWP